MARRIDNLDQLLAQSEEEAEINLTPMLDVVFIMLIFFIVTASFLREFAVDAQKPPSVKTEPQNTESIAIRIRSSGQIMIDGLSVDPRAVSAFITRKKAEHPDASIVVLAGKRARAELVVGVIDSARDAGFRGIAIPVSELQE
jgi:biopolymer transport protein ExbD